MSTTIARTATKPHLCDWCHWVPSLRGVATILPGHRYLSHTTFPGDEGFEELGRPVLHRECASCAMERDDTVAVELAETIAVQGDPGEVWADADIQRYVLTALCRPFEVASVVGDFRNGG